MIKLNCETLLGSDYLYTLIIKTEHAITMLQSGTLLFRSLDPPLWEYQSVWWLSPKEFELDVGARVDVREEKQIMQFNYYN